MALVTGANRGIGFEACRQLSGIGLRVVLTARDPELGEEAADKLRRRGGDVLFERLDVTDAASVDSCARRLSERGVGVDVLVNNAGVYPTEGTFSIPEEVLRAALEVNLMGAFSTSEAFVPGMVRRGYGRVVNVSSGYASFGEGLSGPVGYAVPKAALDALTLKVAQAVRGDVKVNAMCPGWVATRMGGWGGRPVEEAADTLVWLATLPADGPNGGFFRDRHPIPW